MVVMLISWVLMDSAGMLGNDGNAGKLGNMMVM